MVYLKVLCKQLCEGDAFLFTAFSCGMLTSWKRSWQGKPQFMPYSENVTQRVMPTTSKAFLVNSSFLFKSAEGGKLRPPKVYECPRCHQKFGHPRSIYRHRKACEGEYDFKCPECGKCFHRQDSLKIHVNKHKEGGLLPLIFAERDIPYEDDTFRGQNKLH